MAKYEIEQLKLVGQNSVICLKFVALNLGWWGRMVISQWTVPDAHVHPHIFCIKFGLIPGNT